MATRPGPRPLSDEALSRLLASGRFGTLATVKRSGHPHLSTMGYAWDADARLLGFSTTADRVKVAHLRRDPHAALHVQGDDVRSFAVAEGEAELSDDAVGRELLGIASRSGPPEDEAAFLQQLVDARRLAVRLKVTRLYGTVLDIGGPDVSGTE
ncbi:TIGR03618 family F420-dependent PPOX class oxidoreductase [Streptomyces cellulosae]